MTRDLLSLNLLAKLIVSHRQTLFSFDIAAVAEAILLWTSAVQGCSQVLEIDRLL